MQICTKPELCVWQAWDTSQILVSSGLLPHGNLWKGSSLENIYRGVLGGQGHKGQDSFKGSPTVSNSRERKIGSEVNVFQLTSYFPSSPGFLRVSRRRRVNLEGKRLPNSPALVTPSIPTEGEQEDVH